MFSNRSASSLMLNKIVLKQVWLWPYKAPGVVESGSYNITIVCGPRDMRLQKYVLISQK